MCFAATPEDELPERLEPLTRTPSASCRPPCITASVCLHVVQYILFVPFQYFRWTLDNTFPRLNCLVMNFAVFNICKDYESCGQTLSVEDHPLSPFLSASLYLQLLTIFGDREAQDRVPSRASVLGMLSLPVLLL
jgi:hypothetical protein